MANNVHPAFNSPFVTIEARPDEQDAVIRRQGQLIRLLQAKKCPCITNGKASFYCTLCEGKGYILSFQEEYEVLEEFSKKGCDDTKIYPFWNPISKVSKVVRMLNVPNTSLITEYTVASFDDTDINLVDNGNLPKRYEKVLVNYSYLIANSVTDEDSTHDGTFTINTTGTKVETDKDTTNPFNAHGDVSAVTRVYNVTQDYTYTVLSFKKQSIVLDGVTGSPPVPGVNDVLEVDYDYVAPIKAIIGKVDIENSLTKWGEDLKVGDITCTIPGGYFVKRGNVVTLLTTLIEESMVIKRGAGSKDELPQFDVYDIIEDIIDEDGVTYDNTKFTLSEYNDLTWGATKPALGKRYTVVYRYRPSYMIYKRDVSKNNAEDKRFPSELLLRKFNKFGPQEMKLL